MIQLVSRLEELKFGKFVIPLDNQFPFSDQIFVASGVAADDPAADDQVDF